MIEWFEDGAIELYDLKKDIGEKHNLAATIPKKAAELKLQLEQWQNEIGALIPQENPDFSN